MNDKTKDGRHRFKWLKCDGENVRIDRDIVPLLTKMWKLGISTTSSCQARCSFLCKHKYKIKKFRGGDCSYPIQTKHCHNSIWVAFSSSRDVERFYNIVAEYTSERGDGAMYHKMSCDRFLSTGSTNFKHRPDGWAFGFLMRNRGVRGHWGRPTFGKKRSTQEMWIDDDCPKNNLIIEPQITFPRDHLKYIEDRLDDAIKRKKK